ncbi:GNAT family N-acetyltransferase [Vibrio atypicus]|uniref:GNAT family N-acetyltransferase n=1 Tax=Vibrio atypicus TaxID=558271 RepID=UPI00373538EA
MNATLQYFSQLLSNAQRSFHRYGVVLRGEQNWQVTVLEQLETLIANTDVFQLGGETRTSASKHVGYKQGLQLLGQECRLLVCDFSSGFDANSFTAALGCLKGGGLLVILPSQTSSVSLDQHWMERALEDLICIEQNSPLPKVVSVQAHDATPYEQQKQAVDKIRKVVEGHRKRPLVVTADRGRGKSSALGIAAAQLMQDRTLSIIVTAPSLATVQPIFEHAARLLPNASTSKGKLVVGVSSLEFVAPDELLRKKPQCDCLYVDEASALPIPILKKIVESYHRTVFSTTVHGYEGCGRGFTLKFQTWLKEQRPGMVHCQMDQPIRWNEGDPLENWLFTTFLLDAELADVSGQVTNVQLSYVEKNELFNRPELLRACFALLVNAHYQTAPSDLMLLLEDDAIRLYASFQGDTCIGCILAVEEGNIEQALIEQIQQGKRRPKGHLVATTLANQLGLGEAAAQSSLRVMRIAVHPQQQRSGIGQAMLAQLQAQTEYDFYSTSFGATSELVEFWRKAGFEAVKLGSSREQASGTHSLIMVSAKVEWLTQAKQTYQQFMHYSVACLFKQLEIDVVRSLLVEKDVSIVLSSFAPIVEHYVKGGASFDSIAPLLDNYWKHSPSLIGKMSDLLVYKIIQRHSWSECAHQFLLPGKKQVEAQFKQDLSLLLNLQ